MRNLLIGCAAASLVASAAGATGAEDQARIVLGGYATLKKAEATCGPSARLSRRNALALTYARAVTEQAVPISQFATLYREADDAAATAASAGRFCPDTRKRRSALVRQVEKAGEMLAAAHLR